VRDIAVRRCGGAATNLHDVLAVQEAENSTMTWRKKLYDDLAVRRYQIPSARNNIPLAFAVPSVTIGRRRILSSAKYEKSSDD
jgi:hypothetical protein